MFDSIDIKQLNSLKSKLSYAQSIIKLTNILLSSLHLWSVDKNLDKTFQDKLGIQKPKYPISFGRITRGAHVFVMFPSKKKSFNFQAENNTMPSKLSFNLMNFEEVESNDSEKLVQSDEESSNARESPSPTTDDWMSSKFLTTEHLLSILSISNSFMSLRNFIDLQMRTE